MPINNITCPKTNLSTKMESSTTSLISSSKFLHFNPIFSDRKTKRFSDYRKTTIHTRIHANGGGGGGGGYNYGGGRRNQVDENMIVLRKRIHETKMFERNYEPPSDWMEWEKRCYASYDSIICEAMGFVQSQLMNARPSLALGIVALIVVSVPVSTAVVFSQLMGVLAGIHLN